MNCTDDCSRFSNMQVDSGRQASTGVKKRKKGNLSEWRTNLGKDERLRHVGYTLSADFKSLLPLEDFTGKARWFRGPRIPEEARENTEQHWASGVKVV